MRKKAIIVDLDGTLCDNSHRSLLYEAEHKNWKRINEASKYDKVNEWCLQIVNLFSNAGYEIIFLTGRDKQSEGVTQTWLTLNLDSKISYQLMMRPSGDKRNDDVVKQEIYEENIKPHYNVLFAIDDRVPVTLMWRRIGVTCLACESNH